MGKHGKKQNNHRQGKPSFGLEEDEEQQSYLHFVPPSSSKPIFSDEEEEEEEEEEDEEVIESNQFDDKSIPSKFSLYQQSVQSPKGDISYLQKFFLMYVGGRAPLHLQEDFCGTALLSTEWLRSDARRSAIGLDFDIDALKFCLENNVNKVGAEIDSRIFLFHGNVLNPKEAKLVDSEPQNLINSVSVKDDEDVDDNIESKNSRSCASKLMKDTDLPARDIICAFNYSCCCLHSRSELVSYFKYAVSGLSKNGGIFVMDLYGGTSSECELRLQRKFPNFTYIWEQAGFDIIQRKTRISLHYNLQKPRKKIRRAFSYSWRLWSLPEIKDCLDEAGFRSVHFWLRQMPDSADIKTIQGFGSGRDIKYEELTSFQQQDSWNAYIVGVA